VAGPLGQRGAPVLAHQLQRREQRQTLRGALWECHLWAEEATTVTWSASCTHACLESLLLATSCAAICGTWAAPSTQHPPLPALAPQSSAPSCCSMGC